MNVIDMQDRELLELAARAIGAKLCWVAVAPYPGAPKLPKVDAKGWNPLQDDGDAFRLAIKLGIEIFTDLANGEVYTAYMADGAGHNIAEQFGDHAWDSNSAARWAIVRSAVHIGRSMPC